MTEDRYSRQSFLGKKSQNIIESCVVGIVGLGGGGSHIVQQMAHIGFKKYVLYDDDVVENTNLNRLVGGTIKDADSKVTKLDVASRMIHGLQPDAKIIARSTKWQEDPVALRDCDIIFGCVDSLAVRRDLEGFTRRYMIPYIDIGLDVFMVGEEPPRMVGQVVLSMPGELCMRCLGFLNEQNLRNEAAKYGDAGHRPQVIWANGVLASSAVGVAINLLTGWTKVDSGVVYLSYDGNKGTITPDRRLEYRNPDAGCPHYSSHEVGTPKYISL